MFERYTEKARRTIFFARYEASAFGSPEVTPEHLLLAILREYPRLSGKVRVEEIRKRIAERFPPGQKISTSVDLPLSPASKQVLAFAAEESNREIHCGHLTLGLIRQPSYAAELLQESGVNAEELRSLTNEAPAPTDLPPVLSTTLMPIISRLNSLLSSCQSGVLRLPEAQALAAVGAKRWTRKEALGRLIDCAMLHHAWIVRALSEPKPVLSGDPQPELIATQHYQTYPWRELVDLWLGLNRLLLHALANLTEENAAVMCRLGIQQPITLAQLIERYVLHCESAMTEIVSFGHRA